MRPFRLSKVFLILFLIFSFFPFAYAEDEHDVQFELGQEYSDYSKTGTNSKGSSSSFFRKTLLYLPNRFMDLVDVFKLDAGVGIGYGAILRPSKKLQVGYREMNPGMLRIGLMGRRLPVLVEKRTESGFSSDYGPNQGRKVSTGELGLGVDLGFIGVYGGVGLDSTLDFLLGIVGVDFEDDDYK